MHINDTADMTVFNGTEFEGLTYMQVRRRLTPAQVRSFKQLGKRSRSVAGLQKAQRRLASTYK
jgi:hypothetical protein